MTNKNFFMDLQTLTLKGLNMKLLRTSLKSVLAISAVMGATGVYAGTECQLGDTCPVPNTLENLYYAFKPDQATKFTCELKATKGEDLEVQISSGQGYEFPTQTLRADKDGQVVSTTIPGKFKEGAVRGTLIVHQSILTSKAEGTVKCIPQQ
jgi:hypothetical protein